MTVGPRILFTRFASGHSPKLQPWLAHLHRILLADGRAVPALEGELGDGALVWQLVSGNNRQLARSAGVYSSFDSATSSVTAMASEAARLSVALVSEHQRGVFGWYASLDGNPVLACARWYDTERDRARSIKLVIPSFAIAVQLPTVRLIDRALPTGS